MPGRQILRYAEPDVPAAFWQQIGGLEQQAWPGSTPGHDPALHPAVMLVLQDRVMAALAILSKGIRHAGRDFRASGLSSVVTDREHRGTGVGRALVTAARDEIARSGADLGFFSCDTGLRAFYESAGWTVLPGAVLVGGTPDRPFPSDQFDKCVLAAFFSPAAREAESAFTHSRIALYPGEHDRLW